jgi:hypothetical protein
MENFNERTGNPFCDSLNRQLYTELGLGKGYDFNLVLKLDEQFRMQLHDKLHNQLFSLLEGQFKNQMKDGKFK